MFIVHLFLFYLISMLFKNIMLTNSTMTSTMGITFQRLFPPNKRGNVSIARLLRMILRRSEMHNDLLTLRTDCR